VARGCSCRRAFAPPQGMTAPGVAQAQGFFDFCSAARSGSRHAAQLSAAAAGDRAHRAGAARPGARQRKRRHHRNTASRLRAAGARAQHFPLERMAMRRRRDLHSDLPTSVTRSISAPRSTARCRRRRALCPISIRAFPLSQHLVRQLQLQRQGSFRLATLDVKTIPLWRPGDIISTRRA